VRIVDVNLLLYAVDARAPQHRRARQWWERLVTGDEAVGLPWMVLIAFLRVSTHPRIFAAPLDARDAVLRVDRWLSLEPVRVVREKEDHWDALRRLIADNGSAGNRANDAHLAAMAMTHGAVLCSADRDFGRFRGLKWENPLA